MFGKESGLVLLEKPYRGGVTPTSLVDRSRFGNDGAWTNITATRLPSGLWVAGCNGISSEIVVTHSPSIGVRSNDFSLVIWCRTASYTLLPHIFNKGQATLYYTMAIYHIGGKEGEVYCALDGSTAGVVETWSTGKVVSDDVWHLLVGTFDRSGNISAFVDAIPYGTPASIAASGLLTSTADLHLGSNFSGANWLNGYLGLPKIYNYVLTQAQIADIFQKERSLFGV